MKLLLTGSNGFTGQHFIEFANAAGYEVVCLKSPLEDVSRLRDELNQIKPDVVVHLAGISFVAEQDSSSFYAVNVVGTTNLLDALCQLKTPLYKIMLASSATIYGNAQSMPITEETPVSPVNHYAMSKLAMELMAKTYLTKLPLFIVRPFNYTGCGQQESFVIPKLVSHFARRAQSIELGNCDVEREFNDVRFVCDVYCRLLAKAQPGEIYNVCSGRPVSLKSVINLLSELTRHSLTISVNPALIRANDIQSLYGSADRLTKALGSVSHYSLESTLQWMLEGSSS